METTQDFLDALKIRLNLRSDYALGKHMGVTSMTMSRWRAGGAFSDDNAIRVADLLEIPRAYVIACMGAQNSEPDTESSGVWRQIADAFRDKVALWLAAIALSSLGFFGAAPSDAAQNFAVNNIHYAKARRALRLRSSAIIKAA